MHGLVTVGAEHSSSIKRTFDLTGLGNISYPLIADFSRLSPLLPPQPHSHLRSPLQFDLLFDVRQARPLPQKLCSADVSLTVLGLYLPNTRIGERGKRKIFPCENLQNPILFHIFGVVSKRFYPNDFGKGILFFFPSPTANMGVIFDLCK